MKIPSIPHINKWQENEAISAVSDPKITPESDKGPAVVQMEGGSLHLIFKGASSNNLYHVWMDASGNWQGNNKITIDGSTVSTDHAPGAAYYNGKIYVAYKEKGGKDLCMARYDGSSWSWGESIKDISDKEIDPKTDKNPAVAAFNGKLYVAYSGSSSTSMYICSYDGSNWKGNKKMETSGGDSFRCDEGPALAVYNNLLYCCWQGNASQKLYEATYDGNGDFWDTWENYKQIQDSRGIKNTPRTNKYPTLVPFDGKLFLFYKGNHSNKIYQMFLKDSAWKEDLPIAVLSNYDIQSNQAVGAGLYTDPSTNKQQIVMVYKDAKSNDLYEAKFY